MVTAMDDGGGGERAKERPDTTGVQSRQGRGVWGSAPPPMKVVGVGGGEWGRVGGKTQTFSSLGHLD